MRYEEEFFREKFSEIFATVTKGCDEQEPFFSFSFFFSTGWKEIFELVWNEPRLITRHLI